MRKLFTNHSYLVEVAVLLIFGLIPLLWYKEGYIGFGHDMGFPLAPVDHFLDRLYTWTDRLGPFGSNSVQVIPGIFIHGLEALLSVIGLSLLTVQKITYIFWFVLPGMTMYLLLRYLHPQKDEYPIRISGSLFYMMNHYLLQAWTIAERTKFSIVAALPLVTLLIIKVLHKKESPVKNSLLMALVLFFLNGGEGIPLLISLFLVVATTSLTFFLLSNEAFWSKVRRLLVFSLLSAVFWALLSSYWLYPYLKSYNQTFGQRFDEASGTSGAISWSQGISANASWINLFKLSGIPGWYGDPNHPFANEYLRNPALQTLNLLFPALALISLLNFKSLPSLLFKTRVNFLGLLLIAIPLSAGSHTPLGILYDYLLVNLPGFALFRSGFFKFGMIIWFAYAYLISIGVKDLIDWFKSRVSGQSKEKMALIFLGVYIVSLLAYNYPFILGNFFNYTKGKSTMVNVPGYIFEAKTQLDSNKFSTRTLYLPNADLRTEYIEYDWGYFSLVELPPTIVRKSSVANGVLARPNEVDLIVGTLSEYIKFGSSNLSKFIGADSAVLQNDFVSPDYEGNPLSGINEAFKTSKDFIYRKSVGKWDFYDYTKESLPQIYSPSKVVFVSSSLKEIDLVANLPGALDSDAFVWSDYLEDSKKDNLFHKAIIQATCADCPSSDSYQIYFATSKVLIPGTTFYDLGKLITNVKKKLVIDPNAKLELNLSALTTLISDLGSLQAKKDEEGIDVATRDIAQNLKEARVNLEKISDSKTKKEALKKVRFYLSFFVSYEAQWAASAQPGKIKTDLVNLEVELRKSMTEVEEEIGPVVLKTDDNLYKYWLQIPQSGKYNLYIYDNPSRDQILLTVDGFSFVGRKLDTNWYKITNVDLTEQLISIEILKSKNLAVRPVIFAEILQPTAIFNSPDIEFVALNQTKYLVRTKKSENFILGFNSRYDPNWSLREISGDVGNYFTGETKRYQNGKIIEYKRQDAHVVTDIVFSSHGPKLTPTLELNAFSAGWIISDGTTTQSGERVYLLEYNNQNDFYQAVGASIVALILISGFYFLKYGKNKN